MSPSIELAVGGPVVTPVEVSHADMCPLPSIAWRKQLRSSVVIKGASVQGGYKFPECND